MKKIQGITRDSTFFTVCTPNFSTWYICLINLQFFTFNRTQKLKATRFVETSNDQLNSVVAVLNVNSDIKSFNDLKSKKACFPLYEGIGKQFKINFFSVTTVHKQFPRLHHLPERRIQSFPHSETQLPLLFFS
jgi:hypothetical protein